MNANFASAGASTMSDAEFRCLRDWLGLTVAWLAGHLGVAERSVHRWEAGTQRVPEGVSAELLRLSEVSDGVLDRLVDALTDAPDPAVLTYRTDADYRLDCPDVEWPASWHRAVCARLAAELPGLRIEYRQPCYEGSK